MQTYNQEGTKKALAVLALAILLTLVWHVTSTVMFNNTVHTVKGADDKQPSYLAFGNREDSTSSWVKRDFDLYGKKVDLQANTIDGVFYNHSKENIVSWKMTIKINGDCFINNAWCGTMEIHQNVGTEGEKVQTLDLRNYKLEDVELEYLYDGDLLIPLKKGDYLVYYPSEKDDEVPIGADSELTIGMIFYYLDSIDLSNYTLSYSYHRSLTEGIGFYILIGLIIIWLGLLTAMIAARVTYKRTVKELDLRMSGLSYMSGIYDIIYTIDIETDELTPITADPASEKERPKHMGARDQLLNLFAEDAAAPYIDMLQEFADTRTLNERLKKQSISCDYYSKSHGWTRVRIIAMDREPGQPLKKILFMLRNIEDEKEFAEESEQRIIQYGNENKSKSVFFDIMTDRVKDAMRSIQDDAAAIKKKAPGKEIAEHADRIDQTGTLLLTLTDRLVDASDIYAGTMKPDLEDYSFRQLVLDVAGEAKHLTDEAGLSFKADVSPDIPDKLNGDSPRIKKVLDFLMNNSIRHTSEGGITLSIFGKKSEDKVHLLISIKDTGSGIKEKDLKRLTTEWAKPEHTWNFTSEEPGLGLTMIHDMLKLMDSGLNIISEYGNGSEFYFEIDQTVVDPAPIGPVELS